MNVVDQSVIYPKHQTVDNWINRAAFAAASPGTYGTLAYNSLKGPHVVQINMALSRTFAIRERQSVQFRAETFNLPNHVNFATPGLGGPGGLGRAETLTALLPDLRQFFSKMLAPLAHGSSPRVS